MLPRRHSPRGCYVSHLIGKSPFDLDVESEWSRISHGLSRESGATVCDLGVLQDGLKVQELSSPRRSPTVTESVMEATTHNASRSTFYALPPEVLYMVERYATAEDVMALRGTCVRFATVFHDPTSIGEHHCHVERWQRDYTLRRNIFQKQELYSRERAKLLPPSQLVCKYCLKAHDSTEFAPLERERPPESRACRLWTAGIRVCEHKLVTLRGIRPYNPSFWCGKQHSQGLPSYFSECLRTHTDREVGMLHYDNSSEEEVVASGGRGVRIGIVGSDGIDEEGRVMQWWRTRDSTPTLDVYSSHIVIRAEFVLLKLNSDEPVAGGRVFKVVADMVENNDEPGRTDNAKTSNTLLISMCPHLTASAVLSFLQKGPYADCPNLAEHNVDTVPCPARAQDGNTSSTLFSSNSKRSTRCGHKYSCPRPLCDTFFYFYRARYVSFEEQSGGYKDELLLCVVRRLGRKKDALGQKWQVQCRPTE